ncbi:MAG: trypsin-like peptidase domain-containing protein, partial [Rickettsiales bacterium]|nr:trypsin-like peptidase domain-containing protein [Rickettsiales bacterium]
NHHVVKDSDQITVALFDKSEFEAELVLSDEKTDLALLKINEENASFPYLELYDSDELEVGDLVLAIGNPFGVGQTVTSGIISALARTTVGVSDYQFFIQTDAAINPGNSGGALINTEGKLVGINTAIFSRSGGSNGIGFATPSNMVQTVLNSREHGGKIIRPWLGVSMQEVTSDIALSIGLKRPVGALISRVYQDSPADKAGIRVGDIIIEVEGKEVDNPHALQFRMATYAIGSRIPLTIIRDDRRKEIVITASPPQEIPPRNVILLEDNHLLKGASVANLSPLLAEELRMNIIEKGVVIINIEDVSVAQRVGFDRRDIILEVNDIKISSTSQLQALMQKTVKDRSVRGWDVRIKRGDRTIKLIVGK